MAFVADARGVEVVRIDELGREISPLRDLLATIRLARLIRKERPQILHTHTAKAGTVGRVAARLAGSRQPPIVVHTFHGHVLRGYFGPVRHAALSAARALLAAARRRSSQSARRFATTSSPWRRPAGALRRDPARIELDERVAPEQNGRGESRRYLGIPATASPWLDRPHDGREAHGRRADRFQGPPRQRRRRALCMVGDGPDRGRSRTARYELGHRATRSSSATRKTSRLLRRLRRAGAARRRTRGRR